MLQMGARALVTPNLRKAADANPKSTDDQSGQHGCEKEVGEESDEEAIEVLLYEVATKL